jgi:hypothetical protein
VLVVMEMGKIVIEYVNRRLRILFFLNVGVPGTKQSQRHVG